MVHITSPAAPKIENKSMSQQPFRIQAHQVALNKGLFLFQKLFPWLKNVPVWLDEVKKKAEREEIKQADVG